MSMRCQQNSANETIKFRKRQILNGQRKFSLCEYLGVGKVIRVLGLHVVETSSLVEVRSLRVERGLETKRIDAVR